jgi:hypothetical protein
MDIKHNTNITKSDLIQLAYAYQYGINITMTDFPYPPKEIRKLAKSMGRDCKITTLWKEQGGKCHYCERDTVLHSMHQNRRDFATLDHIIPKVRGGTRILPNLVMACKRCNTIKGDMFYETFMTIRQTHINGGTTCYSTEERRKMANQSTAKDTRLQMMQQELCPISSNQLPIPSHHPSIADHPMAAAEVIAEAVAEIKPQPIIMNVNGIPSIYSKKLKRIVPINYPM